MKPPSSLNPYQETMINAFVIARLMVREIENGHIHPGEDRSLHVLLSELQAAVDQHEAAADALMHPISRSSVTATTTPVPMIH